MTILLVELHFVPGCTGVKEKWRVWCEFVFEKFKSDRGSKQLQFALEELGKAREYLSLPGASVKMILEHLALII